MATPSRSRPPPSMPAIGASTEAPRSTTPLRLRGHARESSVSSVALTDNLTGRWRDTMLIVEVDVGATNAEALKALKELRLDLWDPTIKSVELLRGIWGATGSRLAIEATFGWLSGRYLVDVIHADAVNMNWTLNSPTPFGDREITIKLFAPTPQTTRIFLQYDYKLKALYRMMFKPVLRSVFEKIAQSASMGFKKFVETGTTAKYMGKFTSTPKDVPDDLRGSDSTPRNSSARRSSGGKKERRGSMTRRGSISKLTSTGSAKNSPRVAGKKATAVKTPDVPDVPAGSEDKPLPAPPAGK